jgi:hypothetical protein
MRDRMPRANVPAAFRVGDQEPPDTIGSPNRFVGSGLRSGIAIHSTLPQVVLLSSTKPPQIDIEIYINFKGVISRLRGLFFGRHMRLGPAWTPYDCFEIAGGLIVCSAISAQSASEFVASASAQHYSLLILVFLDHIPTLTSAPTAIPCQASVPVRRACAPACNRRQRMSANPHFPKSSYERPPCPTCGAKMMLARIEPEKLDRDTRTFECLACNHAETVVVKYS